MVDEIIDIGSGPESMELTVVAAEVTTIEEDQDRIAQAIAFIKDKITNSMLQMATEISEYILHHFFNDDPELAARVQNAFPSFGLKMKVHNIG